MLGTALKSDAFDALMQLAADPARRAAPRRRRPPTQAAVICQGRPALADGGCSPASLGGDGAAGSTVGGAAGSGAAAGTTATGAAAAGAAGSSFTATRSFWPAIGETVRTSSAMPALATRISWFPGVTTAGRGRGAVPSSRPSIAILLPTSSVWTSTYASVGRQRTDDPGGLHAALLGRVGGLVQEALEVRERLGVLAERAVRFAAVEENLRARDQTGRPRRTSRGRRGFRPSGEGAGLRPAAPGPLSSLPRCPPARATAPQATQARAPSPAPLESRGRPASSARRVPSREAQRSLNPTKPGAPWPRSLLCLGLDDEEDRSGVAFLRSCSAIVWSVVASRVRSHPW